MTLPPYSPVPHPPVTIVNRAADCPICRAGEHTRRSNQGPTNQQFTDHCECRCGCPFVTPAGIERARRQMRYV